MTDSTGDGDLEENGREFYEIQHTGSRSIMSNVMGHYFYLG